MVRRAALLMGALGVLGVLGASCVKEAAAAATEQGAAPAVPPTTAEGHFAAHVARMYARDAGEVAAAVGATLEALGFRTTADRGVFVTKPQRFRDEALRSVLGSDATGGAWMHLVVSVPAGFAPARVRVTSMIDLGSVRGLSPTGELPSRWSADVYGGRRGFDLPEVGAWFFAALEARLGVPGAPLAANHRARAAATTAMPGGAQCLSTLADLETVPAPPGDAFGWEMVKVVHEERPAPVEVPLTARTETLVTLDAIVGEDGVAYAIEPAPGENEEVLSPVMAMSVGTASAWRFEPATVLGCAVPVAVRIRITHALER